MWPSTRSWRTRSSGFRKTRPLSRSTRTTGPWRACFRKRAAKPGDIFTAPARAVIRQLLAGVFAGPDGPALRASIMDENPGSLKIMINARYPDSVPLSTMPPQVLEGLPRLPEELEYRFLGDRLILMDVHSHTIVDVVDKALGRH
jgi:hypothetical protein